MNKILESDIAEFHEKGFLLVKNCFSELEINQAIKKTQEFEEKLTTKKQEFEEKKSKNYGGQKKKIKKNMKA